MKNNQRFQALIGVCVLMVIFFVVVSLEGMISKKSTAFKRGNAPSPFAGVTKSTPERYKSKPIWVKTSDNVRTELLQWQIDQMKAVQHKGAGTQYHWVEAPMVTNDELVLVQKALNASGNFEAFREFYDKLPEDQKGTLINSAEKLGMQGLTSLLMQYTFPMDVQQQIGATVNQEAGIIAPVIEYLKQDHKKILQGHNGSVNCVAYSPDGNYIVSGARDGNVILWNGKTGEQIKVLEDHTSWVYCVAYSPDGKHIVSGSDDRTLIIWNGNTGERIKIFQGHNRRISCVAYSPDGNSIVSGSYDNNLILWNGKTGDQIKILKGHSGPVYCVAYSPDDNFIVSGSYDNNLILWNGKTGDQVKILEGHNSPVLCVAYSPDDNSIVSGSYDKNLILWNGKTGDQIKILKGHSGPVVCVAYSPDGNSIVSGSDDKNLILWNGKTGDQVKILEGHNKAVLCVAYSPDGKYIVSGSYDEDVILWNGNTGDQIKIFKGHSGRVSCVAYSSDGKHIVSGSYDGKLILWKLIDQKTLDYIATQLNVAQARLLYRLYQAKINNVSVMLDDKDADYQIYLSLPKDVQNMVKAFLPFELVSDSIEKQIQEKMNELRSSLFYSSSYFFGTREKTDDEKIKVIKDAMQRFGNNSIDYKACERLLKEIELRAAFED